MVEHQRFLNKSIRNPLQNLPKCHRPAGGTAMIKCPSCHALHVTNTIFCNECGQYLLKDETKETDTDISGSIRDIIDNHPTALSPVQLGTIPGALRLKIGAQQREVEISLDRVIHFGRVSAGANILPEIDLSDEGDAAKSVSRRHAKIFKQGNQVVVEDLDSANGTFINDERLVPYLPEPLSDGDLLTLGRVCIEVRIIKLH